MIQHLPAVLIIVGTLAVWAFYAMFAVAGVVMAINFMLELLHRLLGRIRGASDDLRISALLAARLPAHEVSGAVALRHSGRACEAQSGVSA